MNRFRCWKHLPLLSRLTVIDNPFSRRFTQIFTRLRDSLKKGNFRSRLTGHGGGWVGGMGLRSHLRDLLRNQSMGPETSCIFMSGPQPPKLWLIYNVTKVDVSGMAGSVRVVVLMCFNSKGTRVGVCNWNERWWVMKLLLTYICVILYNLILPTFELDIKCLKFSTTTNDFRPVECKFAFRVFACGIRSGWSSTDNAMIWRWPL